MGNWQLRSIRKLAGAASAAALAAVLAGCAKSPEPYVLHSEPSREKDAIALVRLAPCGDNWCESLWIGPTIQQATQVATLASGIEHCTEIAWRPDGRRVGFVIDGYQLRLYDAEAHTPAGLVDLVPNDARPPTRIARGVTFSDTGAAVTFDDCPRDRSGCRPGLIGIR
jgi:hypothetical protein